MAIDIQQVNDRVRFLMGDVSQTILPDSTLNSIIQDCINKIGDEDENYCEVVYCSLIDALRYLINKERAEGGSNSGAVTSRREKVGRREIEEKYSDSGSSQGYGNWTDMLEEYLNDPTLVCDSLAREGSSNMIIIGGVDQQEYDRVENNLNNRNAYKLSVSRKYNKNTFSRTGNRSRKYKSWRC